MGGGQRPLAVTLTESPCLVQPRRVPERELSFGGTWNWNFRAASPCLPLSHGGLPLPGQRLNTQLPADLGQAGVPQLARRLGATDPSLGENRSESPTSP